MTKRALKIIIAVLVTLAIITGGAFAWSQRPRIEQSIEQASLPIAATYEPSVSATIKPTSSPKTSPIVKSSPSSTPSTPTTTAAQANLAVPFTVQAPYGNWSAPYGEFCEEASVLMAISYVNHQSIPDAAFADKALLGIKAFEEKQFGSYQDTNAAQTAVILQEYYHYKNVQVLANPTIADIKQAITDKKIVIVPAAGRDLGNPYFQNPGPLYHMLVIKGYTANNKFVTNDPGTRHGADYLYDQTIIMDAMHDWRTDSQIELGKKVVIIVG